MAIGGKKPHHASNKSLKKRVLELAHSTYAAFNTQHFSELPTEREGIALSRPSVPRPGARYNRKFAIPAKEFGLAHRQPGEEFNPDEVFGFNYSGTVPRDNVVRFGKYRLQIMPTDGRLGYARARVEVPDRLDGSLAVYYRGCCLATKPAALEASVPRVRK